MSEIKNLYELAGIEKQEQGYCDWDSDCPYDIDKDCGKTCPYWVEEEPDYPPFTAKKQLELIEFYIKSVWWLNLACFKSSSLPFDEELAKLTNHLWEDMTISQRELIRSILNG